MDERSVSSTGRALARFVKAHGGSGDTALQHLGGGRVRVVVVAADGAWGDQLVRGADTARAACERAGVTVHEGLPREVVDRLRTGRYEWGRMAGLGLGGRVSA